MHFKSIRQETESRILVMPWSYNTSCGSRTYPSSMWNEIEPNPITGYLPSSPRSTCMSITCSSNLNNVDVFVFICLESPSSTYHPTPGTMLVEMHDFMEKVVPSLEMNMMTPGASTLPTNYLCYCCYLPFPFFLNTKNHNAIVIALEVLDMAQILLLRVRRTRDFLLLLPFIGLHFFLLSSPSQLGLGLVHPTGFLIEKDIPHALEWR